MQKLWIIVFVILMPDIVRMNLTNSENIKNNTALSETHIMELSMLYNTENITELNTVQNTILNNTSVEYKNCTQDIPLKNYKVMQERFRKEEKRRITQAVVQSALLIILLLILIIMGIKNNYIRINLLCRAAQEYYQRMRSRMYIITANDIEPGGIWDARETYNNMLAKRRTREAMRMIFYYAPSQEPYDENMKFVREPQRQTV
ncbi:uncharacterized protein LOC126854569 [Cataglyphis hispanica]|uniref:uncharacterized protein LOC126854569 n=1 Tax=Cataglyphis hispanica TaxID=1086592 RepID=UPI00217F51C8|nr:uncharacterized protein LOC126854569 [Cataglyphis hispanica]XP_050457409.1 uncharacterized protein LOC126854569 [Cataglyphis hispanica]XP_050457410.1 uncharacterized protein LOC126854569 [Cataglyphis hispanica]XP_050457411.1 uncharacterized protein LOC126854569 [Cataglyphis hispanica]